MKSFPAVNVINSRKACNSLPKKSQRDDSLVITLPVESKTSSSRRELLGYLKLNWFLNLKRLPGGTFATASGSSVQLSK